MTSLTDDTGRSLQLIVFSLIQSLTPLSPFFFPLSLSLSRCPTVGSREAAFVYAISSAGVVHAVTRACSKGTLLNCACDPARHGHSDDKRGRFEWGGCSDNVQYGSRFTRRFVDAREKRTRDARALMNLHNNRAGRRVRNIKDQRPDHCGL